MKIQTSRRFLARLAVRRFTRALAASTVSLLLAGTSGVHAAAITYTGGTKLWTDTTAWSTGTIPGSGDVVTFNGASANSVTLNGNQAAQQLVFSATANTSAIRATAAGQVLSLGTGGIQYGSTQTDLGGSGVNTMVISLQGSQSWTGTGSGLVQFNTGVTASTQSLTNGTASPVTLTFDGAGTGTKTIAGVIDNGSLGGTTALVYAQTGTSFGALVLNGNNTFSGGVTFNQGYQLTLNTAASLGTGTLTIGGSALSSSVLRNIGTGTTGGVTLNNNAQIWNADFTLNGAQSLNFGTGAVTLGGNRTIILNATSNPVTFTEGGNISGAFSLSTTTLPAGSLSYNPGINSTLVLSGTNSYSGGTTIGSGLVNFTSLAAIPATGLVTLNGGALAIGTGTAFPTLASVASNTSVIRTAGSLALTADSAENFTPNGTGLSLGAALGNVVRYTGTLTANGSNYNLGGGGGTIVFSNDNAFVGARSITTNGGTQTSTLGGGGTVVITGQNSATGNGGTGVNIGIGTLQVSSINSVVGGTATSNLGAPTLAANGTINIGGSGAFSQLRYTGPGETTDRIINFAGYSGASASIDASGTGALVFSTTTFNQSNSSASKSFILRGINTGANTIVAGIGTSGTNNGANTISKQQRGNWTLTGSNNFTNVAINGGMLTADYSNVATVFTTSTPTLTLGGGTLAIKGNASGTTLQTIGNPTLSANTGQSGISVDGNGGTSTTLTLGNTWTRNANTFLNVTFASSGVLTSSPTMVNGTVVGSGTVAAFTVTDGTGTDFATVSGGNVVKLGATTPLVAATGSSTTNYLVAGNSSPTLTAGVLANSVRIDASASGGGTLNLGANNLTLTGGTLLMSGGNDYAISGTRLTPAAGSINLVNYGAGKLTVAAAVTDGAGVVNKAGPGLVDLTVAQAYTGNTSILGGVLRVSNTSFASNIITLNTGGILEIGADLNGATAGDFSRTVNSGGSGQVNWGNGDGGFSAFAGNRTVSLTNTLNVANGQLVWGSSGGNNIVTSPNASSQFVRDGFALLLSSSTSDSTLDFTNPIDFVNVPRAVVVGNGSASVDAILSGVLSSSDYSGGLEKSGPGTLAITGANTYTGETRVLGGTLQVGNGGASGQFGNGGAVIDNGAVVFNRTDSLAMISNVISGTGTLTQAGTGITGIFANNTYSGATNVNAGTLLINNTPVSGVGSGTGTGLVTVNNGGTLGGAGAIAGATTVNGGGQITGGTVGSVGTLTLRNNLTFSGATGSLATFLVDIGSGTNNSDTLAVGGVLDLSGTFDRITFAGTPDGTSSYVLANYSSVSGVFDNGTAPAGYGLQYNLTELDLVPTPVPEPATVFGGLLMVGSLGFTQRRRVRGLVGAVQGLFQAA